MRYICEILRFLFWLECTFKPSRQFCATANFGKDAAVEGQKKSMAYAQEFSAGNSKIMTKKPLYLCNVTTCDLVNGLFCVIQFPESTFTTFVKWDMDFRLFLVIWCLPFCRKSLIWTIKTTLLLNCGSFAQTLACTSWIVSFKDVWNFSSCARQTLMHFQWQMLHG